MALRIDLQDTDAVLITCEWNLDNFLYKKGREKNCTASLQRYTVLNMFSKYSPLYNKKGPFAKEETISESLELTNISIRQILETFFEFFSSITFQGGILQ